MTTDSDYMAAAAVDDLRDDAGDVWGVLYELLERAEAADEAAVATALLDAETVMLRLLRAPTGRERQSRRRRPVTRGEVAALVCDLAELATMPEWADVEGAASLLATVRERVIHVTELLADSAPDAATA